MSVDERARHALHGRLDEVLGTNAAATLMGLLPPVGWVDAATRRDLDALEARMSLRFEAVDRRFEAMEQRFEAIDRRFDALDHRFEAVDQRFEALEQRFEALEQRFEAVDRRFDALDPRFEGTEHKLMAAFRAELINQTRTMVFAMVGSVASAVSLTFAAVRLG